MMPAGLSLGSEFALHLYEVLIWFVWLPGILMAGSAAGRRWHRTWAVVAVSLMLLPLLGASVHLQAIEALGANAMQGMKTNLAAMLDDRYRKKKKSGLLGELFDF